MLLLSTLLTVSTFKTKQLLLFFKSYYKELCLVDAGIAEGFLPKDEANERGLGCRIVESFFCDDVWAKFKEVVALVATAESRDRLKVDVTWFLVYDPLFLSRYCCRYDFWAIYCCVC